MKTSGQEEIELLANSREEAKKAMLLYSRYWAFYLYLQPFPELTDKIFELQLAVKKVWELQESNPRPLDQELALLSTTPLFARGAMV